MLEAMMTRHVGEKSCTGRTRQPAYIVNLLVCHNVTITHPTASAEQKMQLPVRDRRAKKDNLCRSSCLHKMNARTMTP